MPLLSITTNQEITANTQAVLVKKASALVAELLGKPERYVLVSLQMHASMSFSGTEDPCAYIELKSIGLPEENTGSMSEKLCALLLDEIGIPVDRTYIEFSNAERHLWGWNSATF